MPPLIVNKKKFIMLTAEEIKVLQLESENAYLRDKLQESKGVLTPGQINQLLSQKSIQQLLINRTDKILRRKLIKLTRQLYAKKKEKLEAQFG
jgi:hypothetical protein